MREIVLKTLTSIASKKRDLFVQETFEKDGVLAKTERRCMHFIIGKIHLEDPSDIEKLADLKFAKLPHKKRHYYVLKTHDTQHGEDKLICKAAGTFYAVCGNDVYCVAFIHSFKITFTLLALNKRNEQNEIS